MTLNPSQLKFFADYIQKELGIVYAESNYFQLEKRLAEVSKALGLSSSDALFLKAQSGIVGQMKQVLLDISTNNETSFYRDPKVFDAIIKQIIPELIKTIPANQKMRIWCAASSFGQEPYSLAMMLQDYSMSSIHMPKFEIVATDISDQALSRAKSGIYSNLEVNRGLSSTLLSKYFVKLKDDQWQIKTEIRNLVQYRKQNLMESLILLGSFDLVLCRNVLIYQTDQKKKEIVEEISKRINSKGFFMLGAAESLMGVSDRFDQIYKDGAVYYRIKGA